MGFCQLWWPRATLYCRAWASHCCGFSCGRAQTLGVLVSVVSAQVFVVVIQSLSCVPLFVTPWTAARQASLSFTISQGLLKLMSTESVMLSNHLILCQPIFLLPSIFPSIMVFSNKWSFHIRWPKHWNFSLASVLPKNIQGWFPLGLTSLISLLSKGLSRVFSSIIVQNHQFFSAQPSLSSNTHIHTWLLENHNFDYMNLCQQSNVSAF